MLDSGLLAHASRIQRPKINNDLMKDPRLQKYIEDGGTIKQQIKRKPISMDIDNKMNNKENRASTSKSIKRVPGKEKETTSHSNEIDQLKMTSHQNQNENQTLNKNKNKKSNNQMIKTPKQMNDEIDRNNNRDSITRIIKYSMNNDKINDQSKNRTRADCQSLSPKNPISRSRRNTRETNRECGSRFNSLTKSLMTPTKWMTQRKSKGTAWVTLEDIQRLELGDDGEVSNDIPDVNPLCRHPSALSSYIAICKSPSTNKVNSHNEENLKEVSYTQKSLEFPTGGTSPFLPMEHGTSKPNKQNENVKCKNDDIVVKEENTRKAASPVSRLKDKNTKNEILPIPSKVFKLPPIPKSIVKSEKLRINSPTFVSTDLKLEPENEKVKVKVEENKVDLKQMEVKMKIPGGFHRSKLSISAGRNRKNVPSNHVPLKPFFWTQVNSRTQEMTKEIWSDFSGECLERFEDMIVESLASKAKPVIIGDPKLQREYKKTGKRILTILDDNRSRNLAIAFRPLAAPLDVLQALIDGNTKSLTPGQLSLLAREVPSEGLQTEMANHEPDNEDDDTWEWDMPEQYLLALAMVPNCDVLLKAWSFAANTIRGDSFGHIPEQLKHIIAACDVVLISDQLKQLFNILIFMGNRVNINTARGNYKRISLESLMKFDEWKSPCDNTMTLLKFSVNLWKKNFPDALYGFSEKHMMLSNPGIKLMHLVDISQEIKAAVSTSQFCKEIAIPTLQVVEEDSDDKVSKYEESVVPMIRESINRTEEIAKLFSFAEAKYKEVIEYLSIPQKSDFEKKSGDFFDLISKFITRVEHYT